MICGAAGCGKTVLAMQFLTWGATECGEPGLFMSFEESRDQLTENFESLGLDLTGLGQEAKLKIAQVELSRESMIESGSFSFDPLLIRLKAGIEEVGAKRVVLDTTDALFSVLSDSRVLRNELARLFRWLREAGVTTLITGERGKEKLTRNGFEEYVSDCVLLLDHRVEAQISKRRLRVVKYRGSLHEKDEFPFLIGPRGFSVFPITSSRLDYDVGTERIGTGVGDLDGMFGGKGYFAGSTVLISGKAGTGKSSLAACFVEAACAKGDRALYLAYEESADQIARNMESIGLKLEKWQREALLKIQSYRPTYRGLEEHLVAIVDAIEDQNPGCVVLDPITSFLAMGRKGYVKSMLTRVLDQLKLRGITVVLTALIPGGGRSDQTESEVSSMVDTWIALEQVQKTRTHRRILHVIKSRGMRHASDPREFVMSDTGISLRPAASEVGLQREEAT